MKQLKQFATYSVLFTVAGACGPKVPTCVVLEDLKTEHCIPFEKTDPEFERPVHSGDLAYSPDDWAKLMRWIELHRK